MKVFQAILPRDAALVAEGRLALSRLLEGAGSTDDPDFARAEFEASLILGEILSNAAKYGAGKSAGVRLAVEPGRAVMKVDYLTSIFDTDPPAPPLLALRGRGLGLIRTLSEESGGSVRWLFSEREKAGDVKALRVIIVYSWPVDEPLCELVDTIPGSAR